MGCEASAAKSPVIPASDAGVGERMLIAPALVNSVLGRDWAMQWCKNMATAYRVVVLCPSERLANDWKDVGGQVVLGDEVDEAVDGLRAGQNNFVVFAQRYDGIDLPDDACRFLVLDGLPQAIGLAERCDSTGALRSGLALRPTLHRLEQGMGRAVRSHVDYAVVVLVGQDIASFISHRDTESHMGAATRAQIDLAHELAKIAREDVSSASPAERVHELALTCLRRDGDWKKYYDEQVRQVAKAEQHHVDEKSVDSAAAERSALNAALRGNTDMAVQVLQPALDNTTNDAERGRLLERLAGYLWQHDRESSLRTQTRAHELNSNTSMPPMATAPRRGATASHPQAVNVIRWYRTFSKPGAASAALVALETKLAFSARAKAFEAAMRELGVLLGASSTRPEEEFSRGPDNVWDWTPMAWVIEVKNERGLLTKDDGEQALSAMQWFSDNYPERASRPIVVCSVCEHEWDASFPDGIRVLTQGGMSQLLGQFSAFVQELAQMDPQNEAQAKRVTELLNKHELGQDQLLGKYTSKLTRKKRR